MNMLDNTMRLFVQECYIFTEYELWHLFTLSAPAITIGFSNPFNGMLESEIARIEHQTLDNFLRRGITEIVEDRILVRDDVLNEMIQCVIKSDHSLIQMQSSGNCSYHFTTERVVKLANGSPGQFSLQFVENRNVIIHKIIENIKGNGVLDEISFQLNQNDLKLLRNWVECGDLHDAKKILFQAGLDEHTQHHFIDALTKTAVIMSIILYRNKNHPSRFETGGFAIFGSQNATWIVDVVDEKRGLVRAKTVSLNTLEARLDNLLP